jgi:hypothetical protein
MGLSMMWRAPALGAPISSRDSFQLRVEGRLDRLVAGVLVVLANYAG